MSTRIRFGEPFAPSLPLEKLPTEVQLACFADCDPSKPDKAFQAYVTQDVLTKVWQHVKETPQLESGGVLVGHPFRDIDDPMLIFVVVIDAIRQESNNRSIGHFTVGPTEIAHVRDAMELTYPGLVVIGWYHSHPGHGVFLSQQDLQIVHSIYNADWHLALVLDSIREKAAFFYGPNGVKLLGWLSFKPSATLQTQVMPAIIRAAAFYNQWLEAKNSGKRQDAEEIRHLLQAVIQHEPELSHWREKGVYQTFEYKMNDPIRSVSPLLASASPAVQDDDWDDRQQDAQRIFEEATRLFDKGNYDAAHSNFQILVDKYPAFKPEEVQNFIQNSSTSGRSSKPRPVI